VRTLVGFTLTFWALAPPTPGARSPDPGIAAAVADDSLERAMALHALNRLTFGPRPGDQKGGQKIADWRFGIEEFSNHRSPI
jgi:hypothetical protein